MEFEMEIKSNREMIKPSTPTSPHLKSYKLCLFDQILFADSFYVPQVFFYKAPPINHKNNSTNIVAGLKESLSKALSLYYPLAGRFTADGTAVDCNDQGINFVEARVKCTLLAFLESRNRVDSMSHFLPDIKKVLGDGRKMTSPEYILVHIQVTVFDCGGLAIGCQYNHKILDGVSWRNFLKNWAAFMAHCSEEVVIPDFKTGSSLFPLTTECLTLTSSSSPVDDEEQQPQENNNDECLMSASFVFTPQAITSLQDKGKSESVPKPTRIEAVSAFMWKHAMLAAAAASSTQYSLSVATVPVDMRPHTKPAISPSVVGNLITYASSYFQCHEKSTPELPDLVAELRKGFSMVKDAEFLSKFQGEGGLKFFLEYRKKFIDQLNGTSVKICGITIWNKFDIDLGFGMPVWIGFTSGWQGQTFYRNWITLLEIPGHGIEAWMILDEKEMAILQSDHEFLAFASRS